MCQPSEMVNRFSIEKRKEVEGTAFYSCGITVTFCGVYNNDAFKFFRDGSGRGVIRRTLLEQALHIEN